MLATILLATMIVSAISLIGVIFLGIKQDVFNEMIESLISFASGALLGGALIHLLPEAVKNAGDSVFMYAMAGLLIFFILEKFLKWRHCHESDCNVHVFSYLSLVGDSIHNFFDGVIIASAFMTNFHLGLITTLAVILHEIPQEIGDYAVLVYGGFSKGKALFYNFITALTAIAGALAAYFLLYYVMNIQYILLSVTAGGFIYIALVDLIPELHKKWGAWESFSQTVLIITGFGLMMLMKVIFAV